MLRKLEKITSYGIPLINAKNINNVVIKCEYPGKIASTTKIGPMNIETKIDVSVVNEYNQMQKTVAM